MDFYKMAMVSALFIVFVLIIGLIGMSRPTEYQKSLRFDRCLDYMQVAIPDPNDTEARAEFIKTNCPL